jgi:hypothetical protein
MDRRLKAHGIAALRANEYLERLINRHSRPSSAGTKTDDFAVALFHQALCPRRTIAPAIHLAAAYHSPIFHYTAVDG